jgi:hypothetical protein
MENILFLVEHNCDQALISRVAFFSPQYYFYVARCRHRSQSLKKKDEMRKRIDKITLILYGSII